MAKDHNVKCPQCGNEVRTSGIVTLDEMVQCIACGNQFPMGKGYKVVE